MKTLGKKILAVTLLLSFIFVTACGKNNEDSTGDAQTNAKGRYLEDEVTIPDEAGDNIIDLVELEDGTYRLLSGNGVFDSKDGGQSWNSFEQAASLLGEGKDISAGALSESGEIMVVLYDYSQMPQAEDENTVSAPEEMIEINAEYYIFDKDGNKTKLEITLPESDSFMMQGESMTQGNSTIGGGEKPSVEQYDVTEDSGIDFESNGSSMIMGSGSNSLSDVMLASNGDILGTSGIGSLYIIDSATGEIKHTISSEDSIVDYVSVGEKIIISYYSTGIETYDLSTGELIDTDKTLKDELATAPPSLDGGMIIIGSGGELALGNGKDEESMNYVNSNGIYRYTLGGTVVEQIVNGSLNSISSPEFNFKKIIETQDNSYLLLVIEGYGTNKLLKYTYSAEADATPSTEIKAYSLYDNTNIRQAITTYQKANPDVYINLEIGVADNSGITVNDALKTLNTDIMAGKGPDVLILDGMPIGSYIEKGLLYDISDVLKEVNDTDGLFQNVAKIYQTDDKTYAIPTKFKIPVIVGDNEILDSVVDLTALANAAKTLRAEYPDKSGILNFTDASELLDDLYASSSYTWLQEDGTLDEAGVKEFLEQARQIYDTYIPKQSDLDVSHSVAFISNAGGGMSLLVAEVTSMLMDGNHIGLFNITSISDLSMITSLMNGLENCTYALQKGQSEAVFVPTATVGISAKSENIDAAKSFIKMLLSEESQKSTIAEGLPVNKKAFDELCINTETETEFKGGLSGEGVTGTVSLDITWPSAEQIAGFKANIEALTQSSNTNVTIQEVVMAEAVRCLEGDVSVEEAVSSIMAKINLYLSE